MYDSMILCLNWFFFFFWGGGGGGGGGQKLLISAALLGWGNFAYGKFDTGKE